MGTRKGRGRIIAKNCTYTFAIERSKKGEAGSGGIAILRSARNSGATCALGLGRTDRLLDFQVPSVAYHHVLCSQKLSENLKSKTKQAKAKQIWFAGQE